MENTLDIHRRLVERCKTNDRTSQKKLYELYSAPMFNVALRILNSREEAEDVLQEAFISMFGNIHKFRAESTFGAWFKRIVVNKSINALKKQKHYTEPPEDLPAEEEDEEPTEPEYTMEHIKAAMSALKPGYRAVFTLYMFEDYSHIEISEELGISVGTSKSQLSRAKQRVRELIIHQKQVS